MSDSRAMVLLQAYHLIRQQHRHIIAAMPDIDHTQKLPPEIFSSIFDDLSVTDILSASHVNMQWRRNARDHPKYWQHITISMLSISGIQFFKARLDQGGARNVKSLRISIPYITSVFLSTLEVFSLLSENIHRVEELDIEIQSALAETLFRTLLRPAPVLHLFSINLNHGTVTNYCRSVSLPDRLFSAACPLLRTVHINGTAPTSPFPAALHTVTHLHITAHGAISMPLLWFDSLPQLEELSIFAVGWRVPSPINAARSPVLQRLRRLELVFRENSYAVMQELSCKHVPHMTWSLSAIMVAVELLPRLSGPLRLQIYSDDADGSGIHLIFESQLQDASRTLHFVGLRGDLELDRFYDTYFSPDVRGRLQSLQLDSDVLYLLERIDCLPALATLKCNEVSSNWRRVERPCDNLALPKLQEVVLYNEGCFVERFVTDKVDGLL